ncbi:S49 family peptidase [Spartinivicinus poritis]|uniref:S49 family peptidase n=1 Tax=Spartinivicinus poritis TaxID=2994640 RepID=A0ABT5UEK0_9GAMM|nr:S49 family peptidase [Spartinivicinus sp. A2-2]MDE1464796.1 S49 family peptidase [Spartinivicinus sp. A2-2]
MSKTLALNWLATQQWLIRPDVLETMTGIAKREIVQQLQDIQLVSVEGEAAGNSTTITSNGVALIEVTGVISRYASWFHDICGGISTEALCTDFKAVLASPDVSGIVFRFDSPGGNAKAIHEFAEMIYQARGQKPIMAYVGDEACSAAYWIASACDEVVIDPTASVGSVGAVLTLSISQSDKDEELIEFVSSHAPKKRIDPRTDEGREEYQERANALETVFIDRVARNMGVSIEHVHEQFGQGGVLVGQAAVDRGMAHRLGSLDDILGELTTERVMMTTAASTTTEPTVNTAATTEPTLQIAAGASTEVIIETLKDDHPTVVAALINEGKQLENQRVKAVFEQAMPGHEALLNTLALDGKTSGPEAAMQILQAERKAARQYLQTSQKEAPKVEDVPTSDGSEGIDKIDANALAKQARQLVMAAEQQGERLSYAQAIKQVQTGVITE